MIKSKYTGIPLYVMVSVRCSQKTLTFNQFSAPVQRQCCAGCKTPSGEFACCGDFRSAAIPAVTGIWYVIATPAALTLRQVRQAGF